VCPDVDVEDGWGRGLRGSRWHSTDEWEVWGEGRRERLGSGFRGERGGSSAGHSGARVDGGLGV
jgi:hypothetical protein